MLTVSGERGNMATGCCRQLLGHVATGDVDHDRSKYLVDGPGSSQELVVELLDGSVSHITDDVHRPPSVRSRARQAPMYPATHRAMHISPAHPEG